MKLAEIKHYICNEYSNTTYVWIPDDWTKGHFKEAVKQAADKFRAFQKQWNDKAPPHVIDWIYFLREYKDQTKTIMEIKAEWEQLRIPHVEWEKQRQDAHKSFCHYLKDEGLVSFYDGTQKECAQTSIDWGHTHGSGIHVDTEELETAPWKKDLPGPLQYEDYV